MPRGVFAALLELARRRHEAEVGGAGAHLRPPALTFDSDALDDLLPALGPVRPALVAPTAARPCSGPRAARRWTASGWVPAA
eukprot:SAG11_NODE_3857_length_2189_cov_4.381340_5_plen_81_part_01